MNIKNAIDERPISRFQLLIVVLGFLVIASDGLDVVIMGFIAPQLRAEWGVTPQVLGIVLSAALLAQIFGAAISGPLADRFGRKIVVLLSVLWFGGWTIAAAFTSDATTLISLRFMAGLGLGAALPSAITAVAEYMPRRSQSFLISLATCGFTAGAALGGFIAAWIIPVFGWRGVLVFGGAFPLLVALAVGVWLPESVSFLLARGAERKQIVRLVQRLGIVVTEAAVLTLPDDDNEAAGPIRTLLLPRFRFGTAMLWVAYFVVLFAVYLISGWLPTLIEEGGVYNVSEAAIAAAMFQFGGPVGCLAIGWMMDRTSKTLVLGSALLVGAAVLVGISQLTLDFTALCIATALIGFCLNGSAVGLNALAGTFYPTTARATGVSWMIGFGRAGATLSAIVGGLLLAWGWKSNSVLGALAVPALVGVLAMRLFGRHERRRTAARADTVASGAASVELITGVLATGSIE